MTKAATADVGKPVQNLCRHVGLLISTNSDASHFFVDLIRPVTEIPTNCQRHFDMPNKNRRPVKKWSLYPSLHENVSASLDEEDLIRDFMNIDNEMQCIKTYDTNIMGHFVCPKGTCRSRWSSKRIAITIRLYHGERYNARVYHQQCEKCQSLSRPILDHSYAERVSYRLKKWAGVQMEPPPFVDNGSDLPHRSNLCEGCRAGHCRQSMVDV